MCSGSSSDTPGLVKELMLLGYRSISLQASTLAEIVNQGKLVSDELIVKLLSKRLKSGEAKSESGFILDGYFPRTINQVEILNEVADINLVLNLKLRLQNALAEEYVVNVERNCNVAHIYVKEENGSPGGIPESWPKLLHVLNLEQPDSMRSTAA